MWDVTLFIGVTVPLIISNWKENYINLGKCLMAGNESQIKGQKHTAEHSFWNHLKKYKSYFL